MGFLTYWLVTRAPLQLPPAAKEWLVRYGPWITIVLLVLSLPALLIVLGLGTALVPFAGAGYATGFGYLAIGLIVEIALTVASLPGLFARKMAGWHLFFYARIVSIVTSLLAGAVIGAIVGGVISLYILFQIRPLYTA
jgi:hypothetical protein